MEWLERGIFLREKPASNAILGVAWRDFAGGRASERDFPEHYPPTSSLLLLLVAVPRLGVLRGHVLL